MPMFHIDGGRSVAVHPLQPAPSSFGPAASSMVAEHLDTLLGEQLLPLRIRRGDEDEPYLLAVDAAGQPVVVEVVAVLDEGAVLRSLRYAGRAATLSTQELAQAYQGGADRFSSHLAAFRETVPATSLLSTTVRAGARLLLVCSALGDGMDEIVEFLLQPTWQVEILQVGVIQGADGTRIVDVSPLTRMPPPRRAMEPTALRLVRPGDPSGASTTPSAGTSLRLTPPRGVPVRGVSAWPSEPVPAFTKPTPATARTDERVTPRRMPALVPPPFAQRIGRPAILSPEKAEAQDRTPTPVSGVPSPDAHRLTPSDARPAPGLPYAFTGRPPSTSPGAGMVAVARHVGAPAALVWMRGRRGECFEALLRTDGLLELPDGSTFDDPSSAAEWVSASETPVDGWRVWRLDRSDGPTLEDLLGEATARRP